ncbi:SCO2322 family protein [Streptomyces sp. HNM0663]|uniref:SCO2322 family protein n=1 Tax=Streptomyces chengmaiensis TaxID=3040919 RepID=A0ABT6HWS0_9ACTN|nr:SCO2322 family protein [Streptomyces chengmaiensis]MDH2393135.1 SCO2322 family protein [Streptomyces chengmaiensis]
MRPRLTAALSVLCALTALTAAAVPAQAAGYRYWSFWLADGGRWMYANEGPATARPADGSVNGYRFSVSEDSGDSAQPRQAPDFAAICADTPAKDGVKRVAVVVDPGVPADAPDGETPPAPRTACARVDEDATSAEALAAVAKPLRYNSDALLCAISGYPKTGCGEQVSGSGDPGGAASGAPSPAPVASSASDGEGDGDGEGGPSLGLIAGGAAVLLLGAAAVWQSRRRRP